MTLPIVLREPGADDIGYVGDTWWRSHRAGNVWAAALPTRAYLDLVWPAIRRCMRDGHVRVASFDEDPSTILGWACVFDGGVHYVYVPAAFRRHGIASLLLADRIGAACSYTWATAHDARVPPGWTYRHAGWQRP
jgi:GNAT superfamily N-acetyltransferase